ncbi:retrovirus-related pol polyprotein from transposon TNT 1-94 [Tanacetum coccineum]
MQQFSTASTPQQNGVVERHNRTLVEAARTMLIFSRLPEFLWTEAVATDYSPSTSSIIVENHKAPPIETTSDEQTSIISLTNADEFNQEDSTDFNGNLDFVPYNTSSHEEIESTTADLEPSNVQNFHQVQPSTHIWIKDQPLDQVIGDPSKPVMTRQKLQSDSEVCMYALTVSTIEPKNIKEAMADHCWIESMQDELINLRDYKFGNLFHDQKERILLLSNSSGRISVMLKILWFETKLVLWQKDTCRKKALILKSHLLLLLVGNGYSLKDKK